jgi:3'-phosphoadenosine 5'-phosphosulfate sulfotransferase (PAPS reductase)/FAD synthetase
MDYVISMSGGRGSFASACLAKDLGLSFEMVFADTLVEDDDLYWFLKDIERVLDKPITRLADGRDIWQVFSDRKYIGNNRTAHCSDLLKRKVIRDYVSQTDRAGCTLVLGMAMDEAERLTRAQALWAPIRVASLLCEHSITQDKIDAYFSRYKISRPRLYGMGFPHNNCGGFCVRSGQKQFATLLQQFPARYRWHEDRMEEVLAENPKARPFLRATRDGKLQYLSLKQFRLALEAGEMQADPYDWGGCGCFVEV